MTFATTLISAAAPPVGKALRQLGFLVGQILFAVPPMLLVPRRLCLKGEMLMTLPGIQVRIAAKLTVKQFQQQMM